MVKDPKGHSLIPVCGTIYGYQSLLRPFRLLTYSTTTWGRCGHVKLLPLWVIKLRSRRQNCLGGVISLIFIIQKEALGSRVNYLKLII